VQVVNIMQAASVAVHGTAALPGPAGLLQMALQSGAISGNVANLPPHVLTQTAQQCLTVQKAAFDSPCWTRACAAVGYQTAVVAGSGRGTFVTASQASSGDATRISKMLMLVGDMRPSAAGDAFVTLKVCRPIPLDQLSEVHATKMCLLCLTSRRKAQQRRCGLPTCFA
jgi:hypothetical protein